MRNTTILTILTAALLALGCGQDSTPSSNSGSSGATADSGSIFGNDSAGASSGASSSGASGSSGASSSSGGADTAATADTGSAAQDTGSGADDSGSAAADTGAQPVDSGTTVVDAGNAAEDSGSAVVDAGNAGQDAGTAASDAGTTAQDAGKVHPDSSSTTADAGTATQDAGPKDAGTTTKDAGGGTGKAKFVRFAALGDTGTGSDKQYKVGAQLAKWCKAKGGCDFVLLLGDNFYDVGVKDENDKQFVTKFEKPYKDVDAPFFITLGNHDYGGGGTGGEFMKKEHYIKYAKKNPKFVLPKAYWNKQVKHVHLFSFDSNAMMFSDLFKGLTSDQYKDMPKAIAASTADWKITFSHHPYRSNGPHGNAGCYDAQKLKSCFHCGIAVASTICGAGVKKDFDAMICGKSNVHFSGHDHSFQWLKKTNTTKYCKSVELIIAGSGAKTTDLITKNEGLVEYNPHWYQNSQTPGFLGVEIDGNKFSGEFIDMNGSKLYARSFTK